MPRRWTNEEEKEKWRELRKLYIKENKTIGEIARILNIGKSTVFDRMRRLKIPSIPERKARYLNKRRIKFPDFSEEFAEVCGILLGDGHLSCYANISTYQVCVCINSTTDRGYIPYVENLLKTVFQLPVGRYYRKTGKAVDLFISSVELINKVKEKGLFSSNKVKDQVEIPDWIFRKDSYKRAFLRGFFDTDGSIYLLKFGIQMSFSNRSTPLLQGIRKILQDLGYRPSKISSFKLYLTRKSDIIRFVKEIGFGNPKHVKRAKKFGIIR